MLNKINHIWSTMLPGAYLFEEHDLKDMSILIGDNWFIIADVQYNSIDIEAMATLSPLHIQDVFRICGWLKSLDWDVLETLARESTAAPLLRLLAKREGWSIEESKGDICDEEASWITITR